MRSYEGQISDSRPIKRTLEQKKRQLIELRQQLSALKPQAAPALRESMQRRLRELEQEIAAAEKAGAERRAEREARQSAGAKPYASPRRREPRGS